MAYSSIQVEWCDYKKYLGDYFIRNAGQVAILCAKQKPETVGEALLPNIMTCMLQPTW